jgi:hypothetical protein
MSDVVKKPFNKRALVDIALAICALGLPVSAILMESTQREPGFNSVHHMWVEMHGGFGLLFMVFAVWHVILNRRALMNYLKGAGSTSSISREAIVAVLIVAALMFLLVGREMI